MITVYIIQGKNGFVPVSMLERLIEIGEGGVRVEPEC